MLTRSRTAWRACGRPDPLTLGSAATRVSLAAARERARTHILRSSCPRAKATGPRRDAAGASGAARHRRADPAAVRARSRAARHRAAALTPPCARPLDAVRLRRRWRVAGDASTQRAHHGRSTTLPRAHQVARVRRAARAAATARQASHEPPTTSPASSEAPASTAADRRRLLQAFDARGRDEPPATSSLTVARRRAYVVRARAATTIRCRSRSADTARSPCETCRVVFAGYGISAPGLGYDDFAGVDVERRGGPGLHARAAGVRRAKRLRRPRAHPARRSRRKAARPRDARRASADRRRGSVAPDRPGA